MYQCEFSADVDVWRGILTTDNRCSKQRVWRRWRLIRNSSG